MNIILEAQKTVAITNTPKAEYASWAQKGAWSAELVDNARVKMKAGEAKQAAVWALLGQATALYDKDLQQLADLAAGRQVEKKTFAVRRLLAAVGVLADRQTDTAKTVRLTKVLTSELINPYYVGAQTKAHAKLAAEIESKRLMHGIADEYAEVEDDIPAFDVAAKG